MRELEKLKETLDNALDYLNLIDKGTYGNVTVTELIEARTIVEKLLIYGVVKSLPSKQDMWDERGKQFTKIKESNTEFIKHTPHLLGFALGFEKCYEWLTN